MMGKGVCELVFEIHKDHHVLVNPTAGDQAVARENMMGHNAGGEV